ncbi:MAG: hypothetical protein AAFN78_15190 [Pseudomonadota bacterium]
MSAVHGAEREQLAIQGARRLLMRVGLATLLTGLLLPALTGWISVLEYRPHWAAYRGAFGATEWFSSLQLLVTAAIAWVMYGVRGAGDSRSRPRWIWAVLAVGFAVLALDERFDLHEALRDTVLRPLGVFTNSAWIKPGDVALLLFVIAAIALSRWVLVELKPHRVAVGLYISGLVVALVAAVLDVVPDAIIATWPAPGFWDYTAEEVGEIWAEMLFLGAFLLVLDRRLADLVDATDRTESATGP